MRTPLEIAEAIDEILNSHYRLWDLWEMDKFVPEVEKLLIEWQNENTIS